MINMKTNYLTWYKNLLLEIHDREDIIPLVSSSVDEPWIVFNRQMNEHYGFTDEELDFIINYDIKYRMGKDWLEGREPRDEE